ncbi:uncharacterized protein LOC134827149 [Culicoides brevitarsis]|uniref:uncharacterized protein LOC134827149 n=1 Tax=Culicoides brevitarsis TaxID=469753 RepID=UPI00307B73A2
MEGIPLKEYQSTNDELNASSSLLLQQKSPYAGSTTLSTPIKSPSRSSFRKRQSSVYIKRSRWSRYKNAAATTLPIRLKDTPADQIPVDGIGCCSNTSFFWARKFIKPEIEGEESCVPHAAVADGAELNAKRLLGKFKDNYQGYGSEKCSMLKVAFQFCSTRVIIAMIFHVLAVIFEILGPTICLKLFFDAIHDYPFLELQEDLLSESQEVPKDDDAELLTMPKEYLLIYAVLGFGLSLPLAFFFKFMTTSFNLRTANRLRTAILAAMFKQSLKTRLSNDIAVHQIMTFTAEDGEYIFNLLEQGTLIVGILIGVIIASVASIFLLGFPGIWPLIVIFPLFIILTFMAKISTQYNLRAESVNAEKLTIVEELLSNFRNVKLLGFDKFIKTKFEDALHRQCRILTWSEIYTPRISGHVTSAMILGGLYLNWCDFMIETHIVEVLVLIILFAYLVKIYVIQFSEGIQAIFDACGCLEKVKEAFTLEACSQSISRPKDRDLFVLIENALFMWPQKDDFKIIQQEAYQGLQVPEFHVRKGQIVGVTGPTKSGKTMFAYSILGQTINKHGELRLRGLMEYYPTEPFLLNGSLKENIVMGAEFDSQKFLNAIIETKLNVDVLTTVGAEDLDIMAMDLSPQQVQRVILARALYSNAHGFVFDEPFRNVRKTPGLVKIVTNVLFKLQIQEKTVILISSYLDFLQVCQYIHFIDNGKVSVDTSTNGTYESFIEMPENYEMLHTEMTLEQANGFQEHFEGARLDGLEIKKRWRRDSTIDPIIYSPKYSPMSYWRILFLYLFLAVSSFGYFVLPFGFIEYHDYKDPWLAYVCIAIVFASILLDILTKIFYATACEIKAREHQIPLVEKLLRTSVNFLQTTHLSDITCMFMGTNLLDETAVFVSQMTGHIGMTFAMVMLGMANYWTSIAFAVHFIAMVGLCLKFRKSVGYYARCELETMEKVFQIGNNLIRGRGVIQTLNTEHYPNLFQKLLFHIEDNSTSIFLQKSLVYHTRFLNQILLWIHFMISCIIMIVTPPSKDMIFHQALGLFGLFSYSYYSDKFLDAILNVQRYVEKDRKMFEDLDRIESVSHETKGHKKPLILYRGVSVEANDLRFKIAVRQLFDMPLLEAEPGAKVGICGVGSNLFTSFLSKIITQTSGSLKLNDNSFAEYISTPSLLFGFVPYDPKMDGVTISQILDPDQLYVNNSYVQGALRKVRMWEYVSKLPLVLHEPINKLPRYRRQQLALAQCMVKKERTPKIIIVIEYPHPELMPVIEICLQNEISDNTVFIIGETDDQLKLCDGPFETNYLVSEQELKVLNE